MSDRPISEVGGEASSSAGSRQNDLHSDCSPTSTSIPSFPMSLGVVSRWLLRAVVGLIIGGAMHFSAAANANSFEATSNVPRVVQMVAEPCDACPTDVAVASSSCYGFCNGTAMVLPTVAEIEWFTAVRVTDTLATHSLGRDRRPDPHPPRPSDVS